MCRLSCTRHLQKIKKTGVVKIRLIRIVHVRGVVLTQFYTSVTGYAIYSNAVSVTIYLLRNVLIFVFMQYDIPVILRKGHLHHTYILVIIGYVACVKNATHLLHMLGL